MEILHRDDLPLGGFAGLKEHRLVMDPKAFGGPAKSGAWGGLGNFVYLADARFLPKGETRMHSHLEVDVISVMVEGRIAHEGSLEHGQELRDRDIQVQRAGGEGFSHNEVNPDERGNRMIQLWVLPETPGQAAGYRHYRGQAGQVARVYGGAAGQSKTYPARTVIDVALLEPGQSVGVAGDTLAYLTQGAGNAAGRIVRDGDLVRGRDLAFEASEATQMIVVSLDESGE